MNVVESTKLWVAHADVILPERRPKSNQKQAEVKRCGNISYRCPVWSAAEPRRALCQPTLRDGYRRRAPPLRTQAGRTRAAPPRTGSGFQCLWCLLAAHSSSGRLYTARKNKHTHRLNIFLQKQVRRATTTVRLTRRLLVLTWCLFSISKPRSMSIGWSSKMEKEQGRKSPSIWTWAAGKRPERESSTLHSKVMNFWKSSNKVEPSLCNQLSSTAVLSWFAEVLLTSPSRISWNSQQVSFV